MDGWMDGRTDGKKRKWKTRKAGGLTGRHTLVLAHKSSEDPFFTFPECDARERNSRPARLPAGNRNHVRRQKTAALWYTSLFGNVSSLGSPVIISKYGTHFYFNTSAVLFLPQFLPINPFDLSFLLLLLLSIDYLRVSYLSFPFFVSIDFRNILLENAKHFGRFPDREEERSNSRRFELSIFPKFFRKHFTHFGDSPNREEKRSNSHRFEFSIFPKINFKYFEHFPNNEEERSNSRRFETFNFHKNGNFRQTLTSNNEEERSNSRCFELPIFPKNGNF